MWVEGNNLRNKLGILKASNPGNYIYNNCSDGAGEMLARLKSLVLATGCYLGTDIIR